MDISTKINLAGIELEKSGHDSIRNVWLRYGIQ